LHSRLLFSESWHTAGAAQQASPKPLQPACPNLTAAERDEIARAEKDRSAYQELVWYSRENCVSIAESKRRMDFQNRDAIRAETEPGGPPSPPKDSIGSISQAVEKHEAATFAGLWIEHQPTYRVVVAFTRDAAATLRKYTSDPLFVPVDRPGPTQKELRANQDRLFKELERFGARPYMAGADIMRARVEFGVLGDLGPFRAAVARGEIDLPSYVVINEPAPLKIAAPSLPADWRNTVAAFPRARYRSSGIELAILRTGTVVLEGGCLRLKGERHSPVILWPNEAALDLVSEAGKVRVLNRISGETIELDKRVNLGGNSRELVDETDIIDADRVCPGPYFALGNFSPLDRFEQSELEGRASALQQERRISRQAALRIAREEKARDKRFGQLSQELLAEAPETFAGLYPHQGRAVVKVAGSGEAELEELIPTDLRRHVRFERAPRPLAALKAQKNRFLDEVEQLGLKAGAYEDIEQGRITIAASDLPALSRAALAGQITIPTTAVIQNDGAVADGEFSEANLQAYNRRLESVPDWTEIRALVEATKVPGFLVTYKAGEPDRSPTRAQSLEITRFMISLGYTAEDIKALHSEGQFPARAYVEQNGRATPANRALLAQEVVVAEVLDVKPELLGDGYRSTASVRVAEALKGDLSRGDEAVVRFISGLGSDGKFHQANDEPILVPALPTSLQPGTRWLMFLSEGMRARMAALVGKATSQAAGEPRVFAPMYATWPVAGGRVLPSYADPSPGDLAKVRSQIAPVDGAFDRAARKRGSALQRRLVPRCPHSACRK
jgi:hypothetical protein